MILVIGAKGQGKSEYVRKNFSEFKVLDCKEKILYTDKMAVIDHLEQLVYRLMKENKTDSEIAEEIINLSAQVYVCDELGAAPVSMNGEERRYVELTGRICCTLAEKAETVIRLYCGIGQIIKGK